MAVVTHTERYVIMYNVCISICGPEVSIKMVTWYLHEPRRDECNSLQFTGTTIFYCCLLFTKNIKE